MKRGKTYDNRDFQTSRNTYRPDFNVIDSLQIGSTNFDDKATDAKTINSGKMSPGSTRAASRLKVNATANFDRTTADFDRSLLGSGGEIKQDSPTRQDFLQSVMESRYGET